MCRLFGYLGVQDADTVFKHYRIFSPTRRVLDASPIVPPAADIQNRAPAEGLVFVLRNDGAIECRDRFPLQGAPYREPVMNLPALRKIIGPEPGSETLLRYALRQRSTVLGITCEAPRKLVLVRGGGPPIIVGFRDHGFLIASSLSDVLVFSDYYRVLDDGEVVLLSGHGARFVTLDGRPLRHVLYGLEESQLNVRIQALDEQDTIPIRRGRSQEGPAAQLAVN